MYASKQTRLLKCKAMLYIVHAGQLHCQVLLPADISTSSFADTNTEHNVFQNKSHEPAFVCPYCGNCTMEQFFLKGCPEQVSSTVKKKALFPYLDVSGLDEADRIDLEIRLLDETEQMKRHFSHFALEVIRSLKDSNIPLDEIKFSVLSLSAFTDNDDVNIITDDDKCKIESAKTVTDIFITLTQSMYISMFNYHIIEHIISEHGVERDQRYLADYLEKFQTFCQRSIFEIPNSLFENISQSSNELKVFTLKCTKGVTTINGVERARGKIARIFSLRPAALQLRSIEKGCVELHFLISIAVADCIFPVSPSQHSALSEIGVKVLSCGAVDQISTKLEHTPQSKSQESSEVADHSIDCKVNLIYTLICILYVNGWWIVCVLINCSAWPLPGTHYIIS